MKLKHLILSHLSRNNNSPELVERMFREHAGSVSISIASRYQETPVYCVEGGSSSVNPRTVMHAHAHVQLSLFP